MACGGQQELSVEALKTETEVTDGQLNTRVEESDLPVLSSCFDNTEDYVEKLQLTPGQKADVKTKTYVNGNEAGMKLSLEYWRTRNPVRATFKALVLILLSLLKGDVAIRVCQYLATRKSSRHVRSSPSGTLSEYKQYLQTRYGSRKLAANASQWPPVPMSRVFKLAMIQKEEIQRGRIDDEFVRLTITGKVDDILQQKTPVELENIFVKCKDKRKFVLIEGAPGSGKSTLALHICQEWAEGKLFQEYDVVVLVRLRDPLIREANTVADLLPCVNEAMAKEVESAMEKHFGRGVLWVLDGWDELPSNLPSDSIVYKLTQPHKFRSCPSHQSSVIVTSRPSSSVELHPLVSSRVEVLGFTPRELEEYLRECLKGDSGAVQTLLERIRENPVVESSCYLPLNAAIVAHVFLSSNQSLPTTNHGIFIAVVQSSLKRYLQDKLGKSTPVGDITSPDTLPTEIRPHVGHICRLAFSGIQNNKFTFSESDLAKLSIPTDVSEIGLLQSVPSIVSDGRLVYFCFLHLSIQELLAAVHISYMRAKHQMIVFQKLFGTPRFSALFEFYAGITKLRTRCPWLSMLPRFLCPVPASVYDLVRKVVEKALSGDRLSQSCVDSRHLLVLLLRCLYEAEDPSLCVFVAGLLGHSLNLTNTSLSPFDSLSVGYFLSVVSTNVRGVFIANIRNCSIGDLGCKFLVRGLRKCLNTRSRSVITSQFSIYLDSNNISQEGAQHIAQLLKDTSVVHKLHLLNNPIGDLGLKNVCEALSANTSLVGLWLAYSLTSSEETGLSLCQLLSTNTSLRSLRLQGYKGIDCRHIAAGLSNNKTLRKLSLCDCDLTDKSVEDLFFGLNNYIEELDIGHWNSSITENDLRRLVEHLATFSGLRKLVISEDLKSSISSEINKERRRKGLPEIEVIAP